MKLGAIVFFAVVLGLLVGCSQWPGPEGWVLWEPYSLDGLVLRYRPVQSFWTLARCEAVRLTPVHLNCVCLPKGQQPSGGGVR